MFGPVNEAQASCGHWVVWDTKAPNTEHWTMAYVKGRPCLQCECVEMRKDIETLRGAR